MCKLMGVTGRFCARRFVSTCRRAINLLTSSFTGAKPIIESRSLSASSAVRPGATSFGSGTFNKRKSATLKAS
ncbi:MAG: hypothetical protein WA851_25295, partial [Xanthobacteraceae bacterium]